MDRFFRLKEIYYKIGSVLKLFDALLSVLLIVPLLKDLLSDCVEIFSIYSDGKVFFKRRCVRGFQDIA